MYVFFLYLLSILLIYLQTLSPCFPQAHWWYLNPTAVSGLSLSHLLVRSLTVQWHPHLINCRHKESRQHSRCMHLSSDHREGPSQPHWRSTPLIPSICPNSVGWEAPMPLMTVKDTWSRLKLDTDMLALTKSYLEEYQIAKKRHLARAIPFKYLVSAETKTHMLKL